MVFESADEAEDAIDTLQDFVLFDKPMQLAYAKMRSDATVVREDGVEGLERHKKHRLAEKGAITLPQNINLYTNTTQNANKPSKQPMPNPSNAPQPTHSPNGPPKSTNPPTPPASCQTNTFLLTRSCSCGSCPKTTPRRCSRQCSEDFRAIRICVWCRGARVLRSWSMRMRMELLRRRRLRLGLHWEIKLLGLLSRGSESVSELVSLLQAMTMSNAIWTGRCQ